MKKPVNITLFQSSLYWEDKAANLAMWTDKLAAAPASDLLILPEMFSTGFSMNAAALSETMDGETLHWMRQQAQAQGAALVGSLIICHDDHYYNRLIWMQPDGTCLYYDKKHLFGMAAEHQYYTAGNRKLIVDYLGWRFCPLICYDLRFPVWSRNREDYDVLLYVANWPQRRSLHWKSLLMARAIENQAVVIGVNRTGTDGKGLYYSGDSSVILPQGDILYQQADQEGCFSFRLEPDILTTIRTQLPFLKDRDEDWDWLV